MGLITRRQLLTAAAAGFTLSGGALALPASGLTVNPRSTWGSNHPPKGPLASEDVKFLIVHHSASHNGYTSFDTPNILRGWFNFHTGPDKGWNDIAYNFIIDSEGVMWEGRQGSLAGAVAGDATGGNQGYTQLVCVIGDFNTGQPTTAALNSLRRLLAWLADKHDVATSPGAEITFTSRGSNRWPAGSGVTTATVAGHRDMSTTACPGNNLYSYVVGGLMADVQAIRGGESPTTTTTPPATTTVAPAPTTTTPATTTVAPAPTTTTPTTTTSLPESTTTLASSTTTAPTTTSTALLTTSTVPVATSSVPNSLPVAIESAGPGSGLPAVLTGAAVLVVGSTGLLLWRQRRMGG